LAALAADRAFLPVRDDFFVAFRVDFLVIMNPAYSRVVVVSTGNINRTLPDGRRILDVLFDDLRITCRRLPCRPHKPTLPLLGH
jgi:hypothetical protein